MRPSILTPRILWAALLFSQAIYVALIAGGILEAPSAPPDPMMLPVLGVVALGTAVVSFVLPRILHRNAVAQAMPTIQHQGMGDLSLLRAAYQAGFAPLIVSLALSEAVGIYGLVLAALGFPLLYCLPFSALGGVLTLVRFPTERGFLAPFEERLGRSILG
ncbi:MAG: hypothetical protein U0234_07450 [Sandaracinus sp.]